MLISSDIMFLMYRFGRLVALVYIRRTLAGGGWGKEPKPTRASIAMVAPPEVPRNAERAQSEGRVGG
jgi:hypothetical protein